jgi:hypothetical protein
MKLAKKMKLLWKVGTSANRIILSALDPKSILDKRHEDIYVCHKTNPTQWNMDFIRNKY